MKWVILYKKEIKDFWRSYKWLWVPLVFILIGVMQPITTYYQPQIMDLAGVPKEAIKSLPTPDASQVMIKTLSEYNFLGLLIMVLSSMSIVSLERTSGTAQLILVRPVRFASFIISKWAALVTLISLSFVIGYLVTWYYTIVLVGSISFSHILGSMMIYLVWLIFILTLTVFMSATMKTPGTTAFLTLLISIILSILTSTFSREMSWSPARLTTHANVILVQGRLADHGVLSITVTMILMLLLLYLAIYIFKRHDLSVNQ